MTLVSGVILGPYKVLSLLGRGGMGEVYRARDERLGRDVAIKILPLTYSIDPSRLRRFEQEARATAALNHPNILAVYDIGTHDGAPYIVGELLEGQSLRDLLGHGALVMRKAVEYGIAVATGLAAAHEKGIIHRDIKPENVFVTADGRVKILDFGIAKLLEPITGNQDTTRVVAESDTDTVIVGTAGYMSPEQVRGQVPDHRSDIFSFGAMLYEMTSGERAFKGDSAVETMSAILKHDPPLLSAAATAISPPLASVIQHCLEKERDQRFQSARDLAFALSRLTGASTADTGTPVTVPVTRWPSWIFGSVAAALLIAVGTAIYLTRPTAASPPPAFQQLTFRRGHVFSARFAPDGQTVISSASWDGKPFEVYSTRLDTIESTPLPLSGALLRSISRTGELAVLVKADILARVPIGGGGVRELATGVSGADWAGDGSLAAVLHGANRAWVEYPLGKRVYEPGNALYNVRVSPDGALLAVSEQERFGGGVEWLTIIDRNGAVVQKSQKSGTNMDAPFAWTPDGRDVWFTASESGRSSVHALSTDGRERVVHRAMGSVRILDIASNGRALLAADSWRADVSFVDLAVAGERDLTWRDWSRPSALSDDGTIVGLGFGGRTSADGRVLGYIRATDGSPAVLLSEGGNPSAFSPDGKWVLTSSPTSNRWTMVPTGPGEARQIAAGNLVSVSSRVRWLRDGQRFVFVGSGAGRPSRVYIQSINGLPQALTPEGAFGPLVVSPDSASVIVNNEKRQLTKYPVIDGPPTAVAGGLPRDEPLAWSPDGESIWVLSRPETPPAKIFRIELRNGRRTLWREVPFTDHAATEFSQLRVVMSADGSRFVYGYQKHLSDLYVAEGLR